MGFQDRENKRTGMRVAAAMIQQREEETIPTGARGRPKVEREIKKRISLSVLPSLYKQVQKIAYMERRSVSDVVAGCLSEYVEANRDKLEAYKEILGE